MSKISETNENLNSLFASMLTHNGNIFVLVKHPVNRKIMYACTPWTKMYKIICIQYKNRRNVNKRVTITNSFIVCILGDI